jgi:hypothetical protein
METANYLIESKVILIANKRVKKKKNSDIKPALFPAVCLQERSCLRGASGMKKESVSERKENILKTAINAHGMI